METFSLQAPAALPRRYNPFFIVLGLAVAIIGSYSSLQFFESLVASKLGLRSVHRKASVALSIGSTAFSMSTLTVWMMHFASMISVTHAGYTTRYELGATIGSMLLIILGATIGICIMVYHKNGLLGGSTRRSAFLQAYFDQPSDHAKLVHHLAHLMRQARALVSLRLIVAGTFLGAGVLAMHFTGMAAMRTAGVMMVYNPIMLGVGGVLGIVGGSALLVLLMTMHGLRRRIVGSIIMGIATTGVHWYGYFCVTPVAMTAADMAAATAAATSEVLVDAQVACVIVLLCASLTRFTLMGLMATSS